MKVVGIIAEYNPFHNGHAYQIQKTKELSGADYVIVAMSGNFMQRGTPAIADKFIRASMALENGADFVFEIPVLWATSSAEYFAAAGVSLFHALGCVDYLSFGCETPDLSLMSSISELLAKEPQEYSRLLSSYVKKGMSYPCAREKAVSACIQPHITASEADLTEVLKHPNNILALEYMKALQKSSSSIIPLPITRQGAGYHDTKANGSYCSASGIRTLLQSSKDKEILSEYVPADVYSYLKKNSSYSLTEQDLSQMLYYKLLCEQNCGFLKYADCSKDLSNKISNALKDFTDYQHFCELLKSKDITYTRISRLLLHILLNIENSDYQNGKSLDYIPYLRLLGFRKDASALFQKIQKTASVPLITKPSKDAPLLSKAAHSIYHLDVFASNLYYGIYAGKSQQPQKNEYQRELVITS